MLFPTCRECGRVNNPVEGDGSIEWHIDWMDSNDDNTSDREIIVIESTIAETRVTYEKEDN